VMHRDARFFPDPTRFDPNRWVSEPQNGAAPASLPKFAYFPFGGGPRICIGAAFATMEAALILATVAQQYQVRVKPGFIAQPLPTITLRPRTGIPATLVRRSA
jgi:cytochrome P450